jgi:hypothetical protein
MAQNQLLKFLLAEKLCNSLQSGKPSLSESAHDILEMTEAGCLVPPEQEVKIKSMSRDFRALTCTGAVYHEGLKMERSYQKNLTFRGYTY